MNLPKSQSLSLKPVKKIEKLFNRNLLSNQNQSKNQLQREKDQNKLKKCLRWVIKKQLNRKSLNLMKILMKNHQRNQSNL